MTLFPAFCVTLLQPGDSILSMSLSNGAHLTHGSPVNFSGKLYDMHFYDVDENGFIDYDAMERTTIAESQHKYVAPVARLEAVSVAMSVGSDTRVGTMVECHLPSVLN